MNRQMWQIVIFVMVVGFGWVNVSRAQGPQQVTRDDVNVVARELYCPTCSGIPVSTCGIPVCEQMREVIAEKLAAGESKEQIKGYFVEQFGQKVLAQPDQRGVNLVLAWLLPGAVLGASLLAGFLWLRHRAPAQLTVPAVSTTTDYDERLERELQRLES
jgi:cytochrome c-type biogenesis protein CcmH